MSQAFSGTKVDDINYYVKPKQKKRPAQIIIHDGTNELPGNTTADKMANKIVEFANSIEASQNSVIVSSIISRKKQFNKKAKEVNKNLKDKCKEHNLKLTQHHNIYSFAHTNVKGCI